MLNFYFKRHKTSSLGQFANKITPQASHHHSASFFAQSTYTTSQRFYSSSPGQDQPSSPKDWNNLLNMMRTFPDSPLELSAAGNILKTSPSLLGEAMQTGRDLSEQRKKKQDRLTLRGQSQKEYANGQVSASNKDNKPSVFSHVNGLVSGISTSQSEYIARKFAFGNTFHQPQVMFFDITFAEDSGRITEVDYSEIKKEQDQQDYVDNPGGLSAEQELVYYGILVDTMIVGHRRTFGPFAIGNFIWNELYLDAQLVDAGFFRMHEAYLCHIEKLLLSPDCFSLHPLPNITVSETVAIEVADWSAELYKQFMEKVQNVSNEQAQQLKLGDNARQLFDIDAVYQHYLHRYNRQENKTTPTIRL